MDRDRRTDDPARDDSDGRRLTGTDAPPAMPATTPWNERAPDAAEDSPERRPDGRQGARVWPWLALGLAFLAAGGAAYWALTAGADDAGGMPPPQPPLIETARVMAAELVEVTQTGFVRPLYQVDLASEVARRITALGEDFRRGARVEAGARLVELDTTTFEADLEQARARLQEARAARTEARVARSRAETLEDSEFATEERLQQAILGVARAEAGLASAQAGVTRAERNLSDATIRAPFDALVTARDAAPGRFGQPGAPLGTVVALEAAELEMGLTPRDLALLGDPGALTGAKVEIRALHPRSEALGTGVVTGIDPRIAPGTRTTGLIVRIDGAFDARARRPLRVDKLVMLALPARLPDAGVLSVPALALKKGDTLSAVRDGQLARVSARVLQRGKETVTLVACQLSAGDRVMVADMAAALDGQSVRVASGNGAEAGD